MTEYACAEPSTYRNIHGGFSCQEWVETQSSNNSQSWLEQLAITKEDAGYLTLAICILLVTAYVGGLIGRAMLQV